MKQKALNVAVALAFGAVAAPSLAGTISVTPRLFPTTLFGTPALAVAPVSYSVAAPLAPSITRYYYIQLSSGAKFDGTKVAAGDFKVTDPSGGTPAGVTFGTPLTSADGTFEVVPITTTTAPVSINSTITYTPQAGAVTNTGTLATVGNTIAATVSLGNSQNTTTVQTDADSPSKGNVAISANPFTVIVVPSSSTGAPFGAAAAARETSKIDVVGAGTKNGLQFTNDADLTPSVSALDFGGFKLQLVSALSKADGTAVVNATDAADKLSFTVAGSFPSFVAGTFGLSDVGGDITFASANKIPATTIATSTISFTGIPVTIAAGAGNINGGTTAVAATQYYFIGITDGKTLIAPTTPTVSSVTFTLTGGGSATVAPASPTLYALTSNGGIVDIPTYVPAAAGGGFGGYYRVINVGNLPATISVTVLNEDGTTGATGTLATVVAAGGTKIFSASDIETALGSAIPAAARPRIRFTAPTNFRVQTLLVNPNSTTTTLDTSVTGSPGLVSP